MAFPSIEPVIANMQYPKINSPYKREMYKSNKLIMGDWALPEFEYLANNEWIFTEKVDGTNIRIVCSNDNPPIFKGRTDQATIPAPLISSLESLFSPISERIKQDFPEGVVLYGEGYGGKIQSGGRYSPTPKFVLFDVGVGKWWLKREDLEEISIKYSLDLVPIVYNGTLSNAMNLISRETILSKFGNVEIEGVVGTPKLGILDRSGKRIMIKIKNKDFKCEIH